MNPDIVPSAQEDAIAHPDPRTSRQLFKTGLAVLVAAAAGLVYTSGIEDPLLLAAGVLALLLGAMPALNWARKAETHFPVFEMFMLTSIPFYAVPLLGGHRQVFAFSPAATGQAVLALILFQACAISAFVTTRGREVRSRALTLSLLPAAARRYAQAGIWLNSCYLYVSSFTDLIPRELNIVMRSIFFGIGTVALFIEMRRWGARQLHQSEKFIITLNVAIQLVFLFRSLFLIDGISVLLLALIGYVSTSRKLPLVFIGIVFPIVAVLHNGKSAMREKYWEHGAPLPSVAAFPDYFREWFGHGMQLRAGESEVAGRALAGRLFERASLFQMLCLVSERTPDTYPYLSGESYKYIPAQLVPRFLWPGKPSSLQSNTLLAVHYGLVAASDPTSVSIAFGMVAESFANFGIIGCAALGILLGFGYKRVSLAAIGQPQFSALGLSTILLAAWSFQVEQILASWLVSLLYAAFVVIGGPMVFRTLFNQE